MKKKGRPVKKFNGEGWWQRFTTLLLEVCESLSRVRSNTITKENIFVF